MSTINQELAVIPEHGIVPANPSELLRIAVSQNADIDKLEKLMELQLRWEANEAKKAYTAAINAFKANPPEISKNKEVKFGQTAYKHATLDHVCDAITAGLSKHGISHRWKVEQDKEWIKVTCVLTHVLGHSEETMLQGTPDNSGSKNSIQAIGSTVTYLQRYTLLAATGLAAANGDNDGGGPKFSELNERLEWISNCNSLDELQKVFAAAYKEAKAVNDQNGMKHLVSAKDKRKAELG